VTSLKAQRPGTKWSRNLFKAHFNTEIVICQADLNKVQVLLSKNDGGQDVNNGSLDNREECSMASSSDDPREEHRKDGGGKVNRGVSDNDNWDYLTSGNIEVRVEDAMTLTDDYVSGTGSMDGTMVEKTPGRRRRLPNAPSVGTIDATGKAGKACRGTGK
jgi:hypothetical protein